MNAFITATAASALALALSTATAQAARAVSPASRRLPASINSFDYL